MQLPESMTDYLDEIGASSVVRGRVTDVWQLIQPLVPTDDDGGVPRALVSEYIDDAGSRNYENLCFLTSIWLFEAVGFLESDDVDCTVLQKNILHWRLKATDFRGEASQRSRLNLRIRFNGSIAGTIKASGRNCTHLYEVHKQFIVPNLVAGAGGIDPI